MKTILLDCDGVVLDLANTLHRFVQRLLTRKVPPPTSWQTYDFREAMKLTKSEWEFVVKTLERKDKLGHLVPWYPGAQSFVEYLGYNHRVVFATAPWRGLNHWVEARLNLLNHYLGRRAYSYVVTDNKDLITGEWLIDDKWENIAAMPERGILFVRPWNIKHESFAAFTARSYADVIEIIEKPVQMPDADSAMSHDSNHEQAQSDSETPSSSQR